MAFREVRVFKVREVLRLWLRGEGFRSVERLAGVDRKTVRRYVTAAEELGLVRDGGEGQLGDVFMGSVVEAVRPHRSDGHGEAWRLLVARHDRIEAWLKKDGLTVVKVGDLLTREGVMVPERTLHRYASDAHATGETVVPSHWRATGQIPDGDRHPVVGLGAHPARRTAHEVRRGLDRDQSLVGSFGDLKYPEAVESQQSLGQADTVIQGQGSSRSSLRTAATMAGPVTASADPPDSYLNSALPTGTRRASDRTSIVGLHPGVFGPVRHHPDFGWPVRRPTQMPPIVTPDRKRPSPGDLAGAFPCSELMPLGRTW
jgi:hypothetical protein